MKACVSRCLMLLTLLLSARLGAATYSPGGWPTLHQDAGNRRAVQTTVLQRDYTTWQALAGASVLTAPTVSPDGQQLYVTTGQPKGSSNLYAFSISGEKLWQSTPWQSATQGVDACAILSSPIVDDAGDIYINDCNQLFAFRPDGAVKWVIDLPPVQAEDWQAAGDHPVNAFTTAAFTREGYILGVTNFGDVLLVDPASGAMINAPFRLPGVLPPYAETVPMPDSALGDGLMDPAFREWTWQLIFGGSMRSANTPAVARNGRVFVVGSGARSGFGSLYALDIITTAQGLAVKTGFVTEIGLGSGSSPALSPAEDQVYVCDEEGWFYGIDADSGAIAWKIKTHATAGAAAVGEDGTIYALQAYAPAVIAISAQGSVLWQSDFSKLASSRLPASFWFGEPVATGNGNPTVTRDAVVVPVAYGYRLPLGKMSVPVMSVVAALDLQTGEAVRDLVALPDDSSGITAVLRNGTIINSLGAVLTSAMHPLKPLFDLVLPADLEALAPVGGIQVALPRAE